MKKYQEIQCNFTSEEIALVANILDLANTFLYDSPHHGDDELCEDFEKDCNQLKSKLGIKDED